jgi:hypothetical protein
MINFELTQKEDSIEKLFCVPFSKLKVDSLDKNNFEVLFKLLQLEKLNSEINLLDENKPFLYLIFEKRLQIHSYSANIYTKLFIAHICKSAGEVIMYCWYLQYISNIRNIKLFTLEDVINTFPDGFPTSNELHDIWFNQKVSRENMDNSDNLLDYYSAGKSILN